MCVRACVLFFFFTDNGHHRYYYLLRSTVSTTIIVTTTTATLLELSGGGGRRQQEQLQWSTISCTTVVHRLPSRRLKSASIVRLADVTLEAPPDSLDRFSSVRTSDDGPARGLWCVRQKEKRLLLRPSLSCDRAHVREGGYRNVVPENLAVYPALRSGRLTQSVLSVPEDGAHRPLVAAVVRAWRGRARSVVAMSALFKRAEQLKRWEESDTNRESPNRRNIKTVSFPIDCAFLASVSSGDKNEVNSLLYLAADINAANADGLTALHQVGAAVTITFC